ncbi:MAG: hypothetical protein AAGA68_02500 [Pseudomonadota bacterium]
MKMNAAQYDELIKGYAMTHAVIVHPEQVSFVLQEIVEMDEAHQQERLPRPEDLGTRIVNYAPDRFAAKGGFGAASFSGARRVYVSFGDRTVTLTGDWKTWEPRAQKGFNRFDADDAKRGKAAWALERIDEQVFAAGSMRKLYRRTGPVTWEDLTREQQHPQLYQDIDELKARGLRYMDMEIGFHALDGFSETDIYVGGDRGDCWRYDGTTWHRLDLPLNFRIDAICCAGDGNVYIGGSGDQILRGREDEWEALASPTGDYIYAADINAMAWYDGRLWAATDLGLFTLEDDELRAYTFPESGAVQHSFKRVTASEHGLLSYGLYQALVYDGTAWTELIGTPALDQG